MNQATLNQLKIFEAVARHGSFSGAAKELYMSQPNVSLHIKQLSKTVGLPLFEKVGKRSYLTVVGRELFVTCQQMFGTLAQFETKMANLKGLEQGKLRLGATTTTQHVTLRILGHFSQLYPGIDISLEVTNHSGIVERIANNLDDLYIMSQIPENLNVSFQPCLEDSLVVLAPVNHPLAKEKNIPIQRLAGEPFIMREPGSGTRRTVQKLLDEHRLAVKVKLELSSNDLIKEAIADGLGISVLSRHTLISESLTSALTILDIEHFPIQQNWYIIHRAGKKLSSIARTYYEYLLQKQLLVQIPCVACDSADNKLPLAIVKEQPLIRVGGCAEMSEVA
ncbi:MAG: LysR family transcriptional regulator [Heteroscytonema crispum UTEX LB 1556]